MKTKNQKQIALVVLFILLLLGFSSVFASTTISTDISMGGSLVVGGNASITGNSTVTGNSTTTGNTTASGNIAIAGNSTIGDTSDDTVQINGSLVGNISHKATASITPTLKGSVTIAGGTSFGSLYIEGKYAYVGTTNGLFVVDIANPVAPVVISQSLLNSVASTTASMHKVGKYAYITKAGTFFTLDVSNPYSLANSSIPAVSIATSSKSISISGTYAYVAASTNGLKVVDISAPATPVLAATVGSPITDSSGSANGIYVIGKYAYVANTTNGLRVVDISNPISPSVVGTYSGGSLSADDVFTVGKYAYVIGGDGPLRVIDVSNPASPTLTATYTPTLSGVSPEQSLRNKIVVEGNYAYISYNTSTDARMEIIDITNPAAPTFVNSFSISGGGFETVVSGKYAYITDATAGQLKIVELAGLTVPTLSAGAVETTSIMVDGDAIVTNTLNVGTSLNVGNGGMHVQGVLASSGRKQSYTATTSATYTATFEDDVIAANATSAPITVNLPSASKKSGTVFTVIKTDVSANAVTIDPSGSETINGTSTIALANQYDYRTVTSDGTNWITIGQP
ncbi:MAG: hypothetical protein AAB588_05020 [Patescibacteria group bacterium]